MATNYPDSLDSFTNPSGSDRLNTPGSGGHAGQHTDINDAMEAVQARVGVTGSSVTSSIDYQLSSVIGGHSHDGSDSRIISASSVFNDSGVAGSTVSAALNTLDTAVSAALTEVSGTNYGTGQSVHTSVSSSNTLNFRTINAIGGTAISVSGDTLVLSSAAGAATVSSVFGRIGAVVAAASDYDASQVDNDSNVTGTFVDDALNTLSASNTNLSGAVAADVNRLETDISNNTTSITNLSNSVATDVNTLESSIANLSASDIFNDSGVAGSTVSAALNTLDTAVSAALTSISGTNFGAGTAVINTSISSSNTINFFTLSGSGGIVVSNSGDVVDVSGTIPPVDSVFGRTGAVVAAASDYDASQVDNDSTVTGTYVSDALNTLSSSVSGAVASSENSDQIYRDSKEPGGFVNRTDSQISFDDGTRTFTCEPVATSFDFYITGSKFTKTTAQTVAWPDTEGTHVFYFDTTGSLAVNTVTGKSVGEIIEENAIVSIIYWDSANDESIIQCEERHGITMDGRTHRYLHNTVGARYDAATGGLALTGITADGSGNVSASAVFGVSNGVIWDEDIRWAIEDGTDNPLSIPAQIPCYYLSGSSAEWKKKIANDYPLIYSGSAGGDYAGSRAPYNQLTGGEWQLTEVTNNDFFLTHYFATNQISGSIICIQGQAEYATAGAARLAAPDEISSIVTTGLPTPEFTAIASVIWQTSNTYTNAPKARIISTAAGDDYIDFRLSPIAGKGASTNDHGSLTGLSADDHVQYILADGTRAFSGPVSGAAPEVDAHLTTKLYVDNSITALSASDIFNDSTSVQGSTVSAALDTLNTGVSASLTTVSGTNYGAGTAVINTSISSSNTINFFTLSGSGGIVVSNANDIVDVSGTLPPVDSVFGRTGAVVAAASDYDASQVDNDSNVQGAFVDDALNTLDTAVSQSVTAAEVIGADFLIRGVDGTRAAQSGSWRLSGSGEMIASGTLNMSSNNISGAASITHRDLQTDSSSGGSVTFDWSEDNILKITLTENITSITFIAPDGPTHCTLIVSQSSTIYTMTGYPAAVKWPGSVEPIITSGSNAIDVLSFVYDGTNYYGMFGQNFQT